MVHLAVGVFAIDFQWQTPILEVFCFVNLPLKVNGKNLHQKTSKIGVCHCVTMAKTQTAKYTILPLDT